MGSSRFVIDYLHKISNAKEKSKCCLFCFSTLFSIQYFVRWDKVERVVTDLKREWLPSSKRFSSEILIVEICACSYHGNRYWSKVRVAVHVIVDYHFRLWAKKYMVFFILVTLTDYFSFFSRLFDVLLLSKQYFPTFQRFKSGLTLPRTYEIIFQIWYAIFD